MPVVLTVSAPTPDWRLAVVLVVLLLMAVTASYVGRLAVARDHLSAALRAVVQLAIVSAVIAAALASVWWSMAFVGLMFVVATLTAGQRVEVPRRQLLWLAVAIGAGVLPVLVVILGSGLVPFTGSGIVPTSGIVIGGAMTACSLTGRRAYQEITGQFGSYEAGLALGLSSADAAYEVIAPVAREGLNPGLDQTRTVGLVTLPGAFVGVLLGGGTPLQAGAVQIMVLIGLMAAQAITAAALLRLIAAARVVRTDLLTTYPR